MEILITTAPRIILLCYLLNFLKYAKNNKTININEWLTNINTKLNRVFLTIVILIYLIPGTIFAFLAANAQLML